MNQTSAKVLLVDDDQNLLQSLRRVLKHIDPAIYVRTAGSGEEGIKAVREEDFDLVISDLRMPSLDGAAMLGSVRRVKPETVRILLSGQGHVDRLLEAMAVSHQYIEKPCSTGRLRQLMDILEELKANSLPPVLLKHALCFTAFPCDQYILNILLSILEKNDCLELSEDLNKIIPSDLGLLFATMRLESVARGISPYLIASLASSSFLIPILDDEFVRRNHRVLTIKTHLVKRLLLKESTLTPHEALRVAAFAFSGELVLLMQVSHSAELVRALEPYTAELSAILAKLWGASEHEVQYLSAQNLQVLRTKANELFPPEQVELTSNDDLIEMLGEVLCSNDSYQNYH